MTRPITKAVIPAAGLGTRFLPATKASPKEMLPLVDKPLIQYVVEEAVSAGIREIIIITGRGKRAIEDHFDISFELEETLRQNGKLQLTESLRKISDMADFCYIRQRQPLGLGHAILSAKNLVGDEAFAVLLGDDIIDHPTSALQQMIDIYQKNPAPVIGIQKVPKSEVRQYGIIQAQAAVDGLYKINDLVEKPAPKEAPSNLAVIGRYILTPEIFGLLEKTKPGKNNEIQLTDALKELARLRNMYGYVIQGRRFDAGDKLGFLKATVEMGLKNPELGKEFRKFLKDLPL
ncbi:MAG: UTP--glucose-1-phosphate uridylyltransferase GalU [Candidatus Manganitrophus sp.]|nr:UTP--glucose-1-phosphate uridylyltransferase GalU [Candidatus Manganitrophus sp.]